MVIITDAEIQSYLAEEKIIPIGAKFKQKTKPGQIEQTLEIKGSNDNDYKIIKRVSTHNPDDFSIILCIIIGYKEFRLRRYNGDHGQHTNKIEETKITGTHVHKATERYQDLGIAEDWYAEECKMFNSAESAYKLMRKQANILDAVPKGQKRLEI